VTSLIPELQQAVANYALALDEFNLPGLEALLTQDTTWTFTMPEKGMLGPVTGRQAVLDSVRAGYAAQSGRVRHHLVNIVVKAADADTALVQAYLMQTRNTGEALELTSTGTYTFGLRQVDGAWRIAELALALDNAP